MISRCSSQIARAHARRREWELDAGATGEDTTALFVSAQSLMSGLMASDNHLGSAASCKCGGLSERNSTLILKPEDAKVLICRGKQVLDMKVQKYICDCCWCIVPRLVFDLGDGLFDMRNNTMQRLRPSQLFIHFFIYDNTVLDSTKCSSLRFSSHSTTFHLPGQLILIA